MSIGHNPARFTLRPGSTMYPPTRRRTRPRAPSLMFALIALPFAVLPGCRPASVAPRAPEPKPAETQTLMSLQARATAAQLATAHPPFKLFLQKLDMPTILVVAENTTDDQLKSLLWFLRTQVRSGNFKALGLQPTSALFDHPGYTSGVLNFYRGTRCAKEMYLTTNPCGPSIHKAASYTWGLGGDPQSDEADLISSAGTSTEVFDATDGWQTDEAARRDPDDTQHKAAIARIHYALTQTAKQTKQRADPRFYIDQPDTELSAVSYQFATEAGQKTFLNELLTLEQDHLCTLGFHAIRLGTRGSSGTSYPIPCPPAQ